MAVSIVTRQGILDYSQSQTLTYNQTVRRSPRCAEKRHAPLSQNGLYDLIEDPAEKNNIAAKHPEIMATMTKTLDAWRTSCKNSSNGKDYE